MKAAENIEAEIFVIDNASTDGSREYLANKFPGVRFIWHAENLGFGKANNLISKQASGDMILFLNPDTVVPEDCFAECLAFANEQKNFGALGIRMVDGSGRYLKESKRSFPSAAASLFKLSGLTYIFPRSKLFSGYYAGHLPEQKNNEVDVLAGAFMMVKRTVLEKTGGFDEDFFMYGEDVDLSYRIQQAGFRNFYFAGSTIVHFKGESTQKNSADYFRHFYGAMRLFVQKHTTDKRKARFMQMGITAAKFVASVKTKLRRRTKNTGRPFRDAVAVVASQRGFDELVQLIKFAKKPLVIKGRIAITGSDDNPSIGKLPDVEPLLRKKYFNHLLFAEGDLRFKEIITFMQKLRKKPVFLLHASGSSSIVGSGKKDQKGIFISDK
jgi:GT2 family glycosyltransferase